MNRRRAALVVLASTALALGLSGCDKPAPGASVFSGTTTQFQRAACWSFSGAPLDEKTCSMDAITAAAAGSTIPVVLGQTVGISVDPTVADKGWYAVLGDKRLNTDPITRTYFRFTYPESAAIPAQGIPLQIVAADSGKPVGIWAFTLAQPR
jgi:hypothetical protein